MRTAASHWDQVWSGRDPEAVTWYQPVPARSLDLITSVSSTDATVVDVGGGASTLVDHLLDLGYRDLTVVDIAAAGLDAGRRRLGPRADAVQWVTADATELDLGRPVDVWHDRAVFHFLLDPFDRAAYRERLRAHLRIGGHAVIATFGPDGPQQCSGLPTCRYDAAGILRELGEGFEPIRDELEQHVSPTGVVQQFQYVSAQRVG